MNNQQTSVGLLIIVIEDSYEQITIYSGMSIVSTVLLEKG